MASGGLLALIDDLASILDDVGALSKLALKKTAGVAGDDLAVGAEQVVGLDPSRELPIVWAVAKGSLWNKCWLVPTALLASAFAPWSIMPVMMVGGAFLCYEGVHKILHKVLHRHDAPAASAEPTAPTVTTAPNVTTAATAGLTGADALMALEKEKVREALRTDTILSAEIVVIALGAISAAEFWTRAATLAAVAVFMTVAIYGLIALIVKADDVGLYLSLRKNSAALRAVGRGLLAAMPPFMKLLSVVGTIAMFLVGGGIIAHGIPGLESALDAIAHSVGGAAWLKVVVDQALVVALGLVVGVVAMPLAKVITMIATAVRRPAAA
jgi:predicted DNA repair protein MutK